jgi:hypothetical protein
MHFLFPSNFVYWAKVKNHNEVKQNYYQKILNNSHTIVKNQKWIGELQTSFANGDWNNIFFTNYFCDNVIWPYFDSMLEELSGVIPTVPKESFLAECWANLYEEGNFQEPHQHGKNYGIVNGNLHSNTFCGIYLLHVEEENTTVFYQEPPIPCCEDNSGTTFTTNFLEEGNVIFFPTGLTHYVLPSKSKRCTVSFNLTSIY